MMIENRTQVLVVGSGLSGMSSAIACAEQGYKVMLVSPLGSERSQSVMAAGGINAALDTKGEGDSFEIHEEDTFKSACMIEDREDISRMCRRAPEIIRWLESIGVVFNRLEDGEVDLRSFGGQSRKRTAYAGAATGKLLVTALIAKCREYECKGLITRQTGLWFYEGLISDGSCYGALFYNERNGKIEPIYADRTIMAVGGQNVLFGKTTGSMLCNGYAVGKLMEQGAELKNLEFIQYHPTTIETSHKKMLITEAARGEGGRLYYEENGTRVYFMEDAYGPNGNLMTRDIVSRCIYNAPSQVYLDISFLGEKLIMSRLSEVASLCREYIGLDVTKEPIPVGPSVHFFMGGLWVDGEHRTNIADLYAVGECASKYHGANRLGGNSLLAAIYSGKVAAESIGASYAEGSGDKQKAFDKVAEKSSGGPEAASETEADYKIKETNRKLTEASDNTGADTGSGFPDFADRIISANREITDRATSVSRYPAKFIYRELAGIMNEDLGIVRSGDKLKSGIANVDFYLDTVKKLNFDPDISLTESYSLRPMLLLAKAILMCALAREESRGAHYRSDYPDTHEEFCCSSRAVYNSKDGSISVSFVK